MCLKFVSARQFCHLLSHSLSAQVGERQHVLVTEESFDGQYYVAHNKFYEQVRTGLKLLIVKMHPWENSKHTLHQSNMSTEIWPQQLLESVFTDKLV